MRRQSNVKPLLRAVTVMGIVMLLVSGVTFAALQSQSAVLAGNTIQTATADLKISLNGTNFTSSQTGFDFTGLVPGGSAVPAAGYTFYLKNSGTTSSQIKMAINSTPLNANNVDLSKVFITILRYPGGTPQTFSVSNLISSYADGGLALSDSVTAGGTNTYHILASMAADAFTGNGATISTIDFVFIGTAVAS